MILFVCLLLASDSTAGNGAERDSFPFHIVPAATVALAGDGRGQVVDPSGVAVDAFGRIYVADAALHRLQWFDRDGRWLGEAGVLGSASGELRRPGSVATLGAAGVAVLDRENRRVQAYDLFGRLIGTRLDLADPEVEKVTGRVDPVALAADRGGALYVTDPARERVLSFDASGRFQRAIGGFGPRPGQFRGLRDLATTPRGELVVTERFNARLQKLDASGRVVAAWPLPIDRGMRAQALPVAVDDGGRVAVADEASGRLWIFDPGGRVLASCDGAGRVRGIAFAPDGTLLVASAGPGTVRRFSITGAGGESPGGGD